jgi:AraC-like DNA-binding protein
MPGGRKPIEIDRTVFEELCGILCTEEEIAGVFRCSDTTLERWCKREYGMNFEDIYKKLSADGKMSLRRAQFKLAQKNAAMAIFLGKQYLGQRDNPIGGDTEKVDDGFLEALGKAVNKEWGKKND